MNTVVWQPRSLSPRSVPVLRLHANYLGIGKKRANKLLRLDVIMQERTRRLKREVKSKYGN